MFLRRARAGQRRNRGDRRHESRVQLRADATAAAAALLRHERDFIGNEARDAADARVARARAAPRRAVRCSKRETRRTI